MLRESKNSQQPQLHSLVKELMHVWSDKNVHQNYQNYYLAFIDTLPKNLLQTQISQEIKSTLEHKSYYFRISKALDGHNTILERLKEQLTTLQELQNISNQDLTETCELMDELRRANMSVAEATLSFNYQCLSMGRYELNLIQGNNYIFQTLNRDNQFLKSSVLRKYISFSNSFDPFFLYHYEVMRKVNNFKYKRYSCVERLFNLPISTTYRMMKYQQEILQFLSGRVPKQVNRLANGKIKRFGYKLIQSQKDSNSLRQSPEHVLQLGNDKYFKSSSRQKSRKQEEFELPRSNTNDNQKLILLMRDRMSPKTRPRNLTEHSKRTKTDFGIINTQHLPSIMLKSQIQTGYSNKTRQNNIKLSEKSSINKYMFKVRRIRLQSQDLNQDYQDQEEKNVSKSITQIKQRDSQFINSLPLKQKIIKQNSIEREVHNIFQEQAENKQIQIQTGDNIEMREDCNIELPLPNKANIVAQHSNTQFIPIDKGTQFQIRHDPTFLKSIKNFKLKASNLPIQKVFTFIKELNIRKQYRKLFEVKDWQVDVKIKQYYMHKFYINQVLYAVSLCCALPSGRTMIRYWGPLQVCDQEVSQFLFRKYIQHIEKNTVQNAIFYNGQEIRQIKDSGFVKQQQKLYLRKSNVIGVDAYNYYPFLSINFTSLAISKLTRKQVIDSLWKQGSKVMQFSDTQFYSFNYLLIISKLMVPGNFSAICTYSPNLKNVEEVKMKMLKEELFDVPYNSQLSVSPINFLTFKVRNRLLSAIFIVSKPYIKLVGQVIYADSHSLLVSLPLFKNNSVLYFGKGFISLGQMIEKLKNKKNSGRTRIQYCVRMFARKLRGRIHSVNLKDQYYFGDFQIVFEWRDFLKGKVQHDLGSFQLFGESSFYCMYEVDRQNIFGFQVNKDNFI